MPDFVVNFTTGTNSFSSTGRPNVPVYPLNHESKKNAPIVYMCSIRGWSPIKAHIIPYHLIRNIMVSITNEFMAFGNMGNYQQHVQNLFAALNFQSYVPTDLYVEMQNFRNALAADPNADSSRAIQKLRKVIGDGCGTNTNMVLGFPKINGIVDKRLDFPVDDIQYTILPVGTLYGDSISVGITGGLPTPVHVAYVVGSSKQRLDYLLQLPFQTGDLSVILTTLPNNTGIAGARNMFMLSSQYSYVEIEIAAGTANFAQPFQNTFFAHQLANGGWILFDTVNTSMPDYIICSVKP